MVDSSKKLVNPNSYVGYGVRTPWFFTEADLNKVKDIISDNTVILSERIAEALNMENESDLVFQPIEIILKDGGC